MEDVRRAELRRRGVRTDEPSPDLEGRDICGCDKARAKVMAAEQAKAEANLRIAGQPENLEFAEAAPAT